jgi:hypothetical protein
MKSIHRPLLRAAQLAAFAFPATALAQTPLPGSFTSLTTTDNILSIGTFGTSPAITTAGAGTRMMWYPRKAAFRAGAINGTQWNDAFIGNYSAAFGNSTRATGANSNAFGLNSIATGTNSTAFGANSKASAGQATAFGNGVTASGDSSTALEPVYNL